MTDASPATAVSLAAASPFELRVDLAQNVNENYVTTALRTGDTGFLHSFTTGSTVDGPGVRLVAWTSGCQFKCVYCHNPDTWNMMNGMPVTLERATAELGKYRHGLKVMGGGFTLSGGEPLMQDRFAVKMFTAAKAMGIHTALDTNGSLGERLSDDELEKIDLVLMCIKAIDSERHKQITGKDGGPTLDFARRLGALRRPMWLRYVLVPGLTDDEEYVARMAAFIADLGVCERVDVMPFHQMGRFKWERLDMKYTLKDQESPDTKTVERVCERFRSEGLNAV